MTVAWDLAHRVIKQSYLHDVWQCSQRLQILPFRDVVIVQVQKLQVLESREHLCLGQPVELVV